MPVSEELRRWCIDKTFVQGLTPVDDAIAEARRIEDYILGKTEVTDDEIRRSLRRAMFNAYDGRTLAELAEVINAQIDYLLTGKVPEEETAKGVTEAAS